MNKLLIEKVRKFVEAECKKPTSKYGYDPYKYHFKFVVEYAGKLATELKADKEIILIAAWLHDIGSIIVGRSDHHLSSAKIAEKKLTELNYPKEKIEKVKECIVSHRGSQKIKPKTLEAQILAEADVLGSFCDITGLFQCALVSEKLDRGEAKKSVREKLQNKWKQLKFPSSKKIVKPKYDAAMLLLK